jgi:lysophospholipase L1-like esterase
VNLGIGGDQTQHVLWRLEHGNWPGITPRAVVLMIGTNNVGNNNGTHSAAMIAAGIEAIVKRIRTASPETHILLLAIFPRDPGASPKREVIADINMRIQGLADGKTVRYLDIGPSFLEADGVTLTKEIMPDYLHLSPEGYRRWAEAIEPQLAEWLAE